MPASVGMQLRPIHRLILEKLDKAHSACLEAKELAALCKRVYNSYFRKALAELVENGLLAHGYHKAA